MATFLLITATQRQTNEKEKDKKITGKCKQDFPMSNLILDASVVVCRGLARRLGLRVSGRRNALGKIMNPRTCEWQSGTALAFAACFRDNSHTAPNYRVPLLQTTHNDARCRQKACAVQLSVNLSADSATGTGEAASILRKNVRTVSWKYWQR